VSATLARSRSLHRPATTGRQLKAGSTCKDRLPWELAICSFLCTVFRKFSHARGLPITIHDEHTVQLLETSCRDQQLAQFVREQPVYTSNKDNFNMIVIGRGASSQVFYNSRYFCETSLRFLSYTPGAYFYQSAVLLEKLSS
jgi:hypothetical protein